MSEAAPGKLTRVALIGAGIFASEAHLPALLHLKDSMQVVAVWSRSIASATRLAQAAGPTVEVATGLDALLIRDDIDAVDIILPIPDQAAFVARALAAGKHVISEKPIAPDLATANALLELHHERPGQVWMVAENWRYEEAFQQAGEFVRAGAIGRPVTCQLGVFVAMHPANKYFQTAWRRDGKFPGGFLLDGGVHYVAALRQVVGEIAAVSAAVAQVSAALPPADTLAATLRFENGAVGTYLTTFAGGSPWTTPLTVVGDAGSLRVDQGKVELSDGDGIVHTLDFGARHGVERELAAFAAAVQTGTVLRNTPDEGLRDLAVIEAMLRSAETGRTEQITWKGRDPSPSW